jgi:phage host-nuclease inhibitor protein Gam
MKITTRHQLECAVADYVRLKLAHAGETARLESEKIELDKKAAPRLSDMEQQAEAIETEVQAYCVAHRAELFTHGKSVDLRAGTLSFEVTPPRVDKPRRLTWDAVLARLQSLPWAGKYIRQAEPEVNKKALLDDRSALTASQQEQIGIRFEQEELFRITPRPEMIPASTSEV